MKIEKNFSLKNYNWFWVDCIWENAFFVQNENDIFDLPKDFALLWQGYNTLLKSEKIENVAINNIFWIEKIFEDEQKVRIKFWSWVDWKDLMQYCLQNQYWGLENLISIPWTVWAAVVWNIWAYWVEQSKRFFSASWVDLENFCIFEISKDSCEFWYRYSIFKTKKVFLTYVVYEFSKIPKPILSYGDLKNLQNPTQKEISQKIASIREEKLPNPKILWSCGSFFKNPIISNEKFFELKKLDENLPSYEDKNWKKIPAAYLIENAGLKWYKYENCGTYSKQPLVLVNYGKASWNQIFDLSQQIVQKVYEKYKIILEPEVIIL